MRSKCCPYCGSDEGYYQLDVVHRYLIFDFDDNPNRATEDITDKIGKRKYCVNCKRILPKKMFEEKSK